MRRDLTRTNSYLKLAFGGRRPRSAPLLDFSDNINFLASARGRLAGP